jgi:hypothetical protein
MIFQYGNYTHADNEVSLSVSKRAVLSGRGYRKCTRVVFGISGQLIATDTPTLTTKMATLENAYYYHDLNAGLYYSAGGLTAHSLNVANTLGGVRSSGVKWGDGNGTEYVTRRTYSITLEADLNDGESNILEFRESISITGTGGPRFVLLETLEDQPQYQVTVQQTIVHATQSGSALGLLGYVDFPSPIWPDAVKQDLMNQARTGPAIWRRGAWEYPCSWSYQFESNQALSGTPTTR